METEKCLKLKLNIFLNVSGTMMMTTRRASFNFESTYTQLSSNVPCPEAAPFNEAHDEGAGLSLLDVLFILTRRIFYFQFKLP